MLQLFRPSLSYSFLRSILLAQVLFLSPQLSRSQQIGSFFTAIYLNGAPVAVGQTSCGDMGQSQYCCASGQSCAWDDAGRVACCAAGSACQGSAAYSGNAGVPTTSWQPSPTWQPMTTTVWQPQPTTNCNCEPTPYVAPAPVVPVTQATLQTSYYAPPATTYVQSQATAVVPPAGGISTIGPVPCPTVSTVTYANVGAPIRTVGCFVIINGADRTKGRGMKWKVIYLTMFWILRVGVR